MSSGFWANRSKSTSSIIEESASKSVYSNSRTSVSQSLRNEKKDVNANKTYLADEIICGYTSPTETPLKPRNFVKKLVASLERKSNENLHCRANEEFVTKCYRRPEVHPPSALQRRFFSSVDLQENQIPANEKLHKSEEKSELINDRSSSARTGLSIAQNSITVSSFDRTRTYESRRLDYFDSKHLEDEDLRGRVVYWSDDEILAKKLVKDSTNTVPACMELKKKKKIGRKKSFKNFLGSIVRWRRTEKCKPRRIRSCDNLDENVDNLRRIVECLPRALSLQAVIFDDESQSHLSQATERNATIRPIYGGKRNPRTPGKVPENFHQRLVSPKIELRKFPATLSPENDSENLVKPSAIKNMAKRLSQSVDYSRMDHTSGPRGPEKRKPFLNGSPRRCDSTSSVYDVPISTNGNCSTFSVDRKVQTEYSAILASERNNRSYYDVPIKKK